MKKLLLVALLLLAMVFTMVACQDTEKPEETTGDKPVVTDEPTEKPTEAPTEDPDKDTQAPTTPDTPAPTDPDTPAPTDPAPTEPATPAPTEPVVTEPPTEPEPVDPDAPISVFDADALNNLDRPNFIESAEVIDGALHIIPSSSDPHYYPFSNVEGGRYVAIKYRSEIGDGMAIQFYLASSGTGPSDDTSMLKQSLIADGEWHVAIIDTKPLIDAGIYDGSKVSYFRFDPMECDYILDENGQPQKDETGTWIRYPKPEGANIDVKYIAFFNSADAVEKYESQPLALVTPEQIASAAPSGNTTDATLGDGFTTVIGTGGDSYFTLPVSGVKGTIVAIKYRTTYSDSGEFFVGSSGGPHGGDDEVSFTYEGDNEWHLLLVDVTAAAAVTDGIGYLRYDCFGAADGKTIDIAYFGVFESAAQAEAYDKLLTALPNDTHNFEVNAADEEGTSVAGSTLSSVFAFLQAAAGPSPIENGAYVFKGYTEAIATANGAYAFTADSVGSGNLNLAMMFVRGVYNFNFGDGGYFGAIWENGAGANWTGYAGSAGIYLLPVKAEDGSVTLTVRFNCWDGTKASIKAYNIPVPSTEITVVDNGTDVSIISGDTLAAIVTISGTKDFGYTGQNGAVVAPDACAETVTITLADGTEELVENAVVASTHLAQLGLATRDGGQLTVTNVSLKGATSVEIPDFPYVNTFADWNVTEDWTEVKENGKYVLQGKGELAYNDLLSIDAIAGSHIKFNARIDSAFGTEAGDVGVVITTDDVAYYVVYDNVNNFLAIRRLTPTEDKVLAMVPYFGLKLDTWYSFDFYASQDHICLFIDGEYQIGTFDTGADDLTDAAAGFICNNTTISLSGIKVDSEASDFAFITTDKTEYFITEDIKVYAHGGKADWVGLYKADDNVAEGGATSLYWYYVNKEGHTSGDGVIIQNAEHVNSANIPAGDYKLVLCKNDGYEIVGEVYFTVKTKDVVIDAPAWDANKDIVTHQSFDELKVNDTTGLFTPGQAAGWDKVAVLDETAETLKYWGWIGAKGEIGLFGYQIDNNAPVYSASFAVEPEPGVVAAAAGTGADSASRMAIFVDLAGLKGAHNVKILYKNDKGVEVLLNEFTVKMPFPVVAWDADKSVVTHLSFDELRINETATGIFTPGQAAGWNLKADIGADVTTLCYWGWIGAKGEIGQFGYMIDDNAPVFSASFAVEPEPGVVAAAAGTGADNASRMLIAIDLSQIEGQHTVTALYMNPDGVTVALTTFEVNRTIVPVADLVLDVNGTDYDCFLVENWDTVTAEPFMGWGICESDGKGNLKIDCNGTNIMCAYGIEGALFTADKAVGFETFVFPIVENNSTGDVLFIFQPYSPKAENNVTLGKTAAAYFVDAEGNVTKVDPVADGDRVGYKVEKGFTGTILIPYTAITTYDDFNTSLYASADEIDITKLGFLIQPFTGSEGGQLIIGDVYVTNAILEAPVHVIDADGLKNATNVKGIASIEENDGYVTITPNGADPYCSLAAGFTGARYAVVKYRTTTAGGCNTQIYVGSTGTGPSNDNTMLQLPLVGDGEWHTVVFDLDTLTEKLNAEYYISYIRFDALQAGFQTDDDGNYIYVDGSTTNIAKLPLPEGCSIDVASIAFFADEASAKAYN